MNLFSSNDKYNAYEKKWVDFASNYIEDLKKMRLNVNENWISNFFIQTIHLSTLILPTIIDSRFMFSKKPARKELRSFFGKINKLSESEFRAVIMLIAFDYFNQDRPSIRDIVNSEFPNNELESLLYKYYLCSDKDKETFKRFVLNGESYLPTFELLSSLHFDEYSKDEKIVQLCEFVKNELYDQFDLSFLKIHQKKIFLEE